MEEKSHDAESSGQQLIVVLLDRRPTKYTPEFGTNRQLAAEYFGTTPLPATQLRGVDNELSAQLSYAMEDPALWRVSEKCTCFCRWATGSVLLVQLLLELGQKRRSRTITLVLPRLVRVGDSIIRSS